MSNNQKLFGRHHEVVLLLFGFVFTTLVGGYLTYNWQGRAAEYERIAEYRRLEQEAATRVFEELSRLMDKRLYRMRRLHTGISSWGRDHKEVAKRWESYREALFIWNENQ